MASTKAIVPPRRAASAVEAAVSDEAGAFAEPAQHHEPKRRRCLRCQTAFDSAWAGDRICGRCKHTTAWRAGQPAAPPSTRNTKPR